MNDIRDAFILYRQLAQLLRVWLGWSVGGSVPKRCDIDPLTFKTLLPNVQLLDVGDAPDDLRYRLVGGEISRAFGFEPRGKTRGEIRRARVLPENLDDFDQTSRETHGVASRGVVAYTQDHMTSYDRGEIAYSRLLLPISEDGEAITGVLGGIIMFDDNPAYWGKFTHLHVEVPIESFGLKARLLDRRTHPE